MTPCTRKAPPGTGAKARLLIAMGVIRWQIKILQYWEGWYTTQGTKADLMPCALGGSLWSFWTLRTGARVVDSEAAGLDLLAEL